MNLEQAKAKLESVKNSTGTKHSKALILELCSVIGFLMGELDRTKSPPTSVLPNTRSDPGESVQPDVQIPWDRSTGDNPTRPTPRKRRGDAGDAR
jgi:hypothetical protein